MLCYRFAVRILRLNLYRQTANSALRCSYMKVEQVEEMFPSKGEQRIAQRLIETLKNCPDINVEKIAELMFPHKLPSAKIEVSNGLYHILDGLRALGIITCTLDNFILSPKNKAAQSIFPGSDKAKNRNLPLKGQSRYVLFLCETCGAAVGSRGSQKSSTCKTCNHINNVDGDNNVLLRTNSFLELQEAIQQAKIESFNKKK